MVTTAYSSCTISSAGHESTTSDAHASSLSAPSPPTKLMSIPPTKRSGGRPELEGEDDDDEEEDEEDDDEDDGEDEDEASDVADDFSSTIANALPLQPHPGSGASPRWYGCE